MKSSNQLKYLQINNPSHETTKPRKMKPIFLNKATWRCIQSSDISYINKHKPKLLSRVSISHLRSENIGVHGLGNLRRAFKDSKTVYSVFFDHPIANAKQLEYLLNSTNQWRSISFISQERTPPLEEEFIKSLSRIGRCKTLSDFPLPNLPIQQEINKRIATRIYQQLKQLNQLKSLSLSMPLYDNTAILNYRLPQNLTKLHLSLKNKDLLNQQRLSKCITNLQCCHLLEQLTLTFSRGYPIELSDAEIWTSFFQNTPKLLKNLHVNLYLRGDQPPEGIQAFLGSLKLLKDLTSLNFSSFHPWILDRPVPFQNSYFSSVFNNLQCLTQLENLELKLYSYQYIENHEIQDFASMLQSLKSLKSLVIQLPRFQNPNDGLILIAQALKTTTNLRTLDLRSPSIFRHKPIQILYTNIAHHQNLTSLCLDIRFSQYYRTSKASAIMKSLANLFCLSRNNNPPSFFLNLQNLTQLSTLELQLSAVHNSPQEWRSFSISLQKLSRLSSLNLTFAHLNSAKNFKVLHKFLSCLKSLSKLTQLELRFEGSQISDGQVKILSSHLVGCQYLTTLSLQFKKAGELKDGSLYSLLPAIRGLSKLKDLNLLFKRDEAFGEKAVSDFLEGLVVLKELSKFYFLYVEGSIPFNNHTPLPPNLKDYENLRCLTHFIVNASRYV